MSLVGIIKKAWALATFPLEKTRIHQNLSDQFKLYEKLTAPLVRNRKRSLALRGTAATLSIASSLALFTWTGHQGRYTEINQVAEKPLPARFKMVSYNIAMGDGGPFEWTKSLFKSPLTEYSPKGIEGVVKTLNDNKASIACLNEIGISGVRGEHQPRIIAELTPLKNYVFGSNITFAASYWNPFEGVRHDFLANGNAIMSTARIIDTTHIRSTEPFKPATISTFNDWLVGTEGLLHAAIVYNGERINIYCNHFSNREFESFPGIKHERDRTTEARLLAAFISAPAIVVGDFNTTPLPSQNISYGDDGQKYLNERTLLVFNEELVKRGLVLSSALENIMDSNRTKTYPGTYMGRVQTEDLGKPRGGIGRKYERIDYVFVVNNPNKKLQLRIVSDKVECPRLDSDHCPVVAEVEAVYSLKILPTKSAATTTSKKQY
ncbi:MAG TPA: hypothetical protein VJI98_02270 [Candidatus Nanoarchaeia archaeon]|nr:hypothetical protein [Candidatus Nanoarchaeia archaeon]